MVMWWSYCQSENVEAVIIESDILNTTLNVHLIYSAFHRSMQGITFGYGTCHSRVHNKEVVT